MFTGQYPSIMVESFNPDAITTTSYKWAGPCVVTGHINNTYNNTSCDAAPSTLASLNPSSSDYISSTGGSNLIPNLGLPPDKTYQYTAAFERELLSNVALTVTYNEHRVYDLATPAGNAPYLNRPYSAYSIPVAKTDPLTNDPVTVYTYPTSYAGSAFDKRQLAPAPDSRPNYYRTIDVSFTRRYSKNWNALAGFWVTKRHEWLAGAAAPTSPNDDRFPVDETTNWEARGNILYNLPHGFQVSSYYKAQSGFAGQRTATFGSSPQLSSVTLRMGPLGQYRGPVISVLNVKVQKTFRIGEDMRFEPNFQVFNLLNNSAAVTSNYSTGSTFGYATTVVSPRVARIGGYFSF
jgi:hypothetical protein